MAHSVQADNSVISENSNAWPYANGFLPSALCPLTSVVYDSLLKIGQVVKIFLDEFSRNRAGQGKGQTLLVKEDS